MLFLGYLEGVAVGKIKRQNKIVKTAPKMNLAVVGRTLAREHTAQYFECLAQI
jgi:hypothetical protein